MKKDASKLIPIHLIITRLLLNNMIVIKLVQCGEAAFVPTAVLDHLADKRLSFWRLLLSVAF